MRMTQTSTPATRTFRILGTTDDVTECGLCGREELKGTVALEHLDTEGQPTGEVRYFGTSCAAKASGWTTLQVRQIAKKADLERQEAERVAREAEHRARMETYADHLEAETGSRDLWVAAKARGFSSPFQMQKADRTAGVAGV